MFPPQEEHIPHRRWNPAPSWRSATANSRKASPARATISWGNSTRTAFGSASWKAIRSSNRNTSCCWRFWTRRLRRRADVRELHAGAATAGGRLVDLSRRADGNVRLGQSLLRPQNHGPRPRVRTDGPRRKAIRAAGGAEKVNSFTRYYLALLGIIRYSQCPAVPPELMLIPRWMPFNIYEMSAWSRTILVPLVLAVGLSSGPRTAEGISHR